jgi:hypothetical protein
MLSAVRGGRANDEFARNIKHAGNAMIQRQIYGTSDPQLNGGVHDFLVVLLHLLPEQAERCIIES